ncbi:MAG: hypothetical protein PVH39_10040 [Syntrophobacterales bacterium]|jgi:hypothetical protein
MEHGAWGRKLRIADFELRIEQAARRERREKRERQEDGFSDLNESGEAG